MHILIGSQILAFYYLGSLGWRFKWVLGVLPLFQCGGQFTLPHLLKQKKKKKKASTTLAYHSTKVAPTYVCRAIKIPKSK
jgi:hypothetical protein